MTTPSATTSPTIPPQLYHERQSRQLCAVHALNNLLQAKRFSHADFSRLARTLPAQSTWFLGNFDVNVLQAAAAEAGIDLAYFNARRAETPGALEAVVASAAAAADEDGGGGGGGGAPPLTGVLLNVAAQGWWSRLRGARHWVALLPVLDKGDPAAPARWFNLDSKLPAPKPVPAEGDGGVAAYLRARLASEGATLLVARPKKKGGGGRS